MSVAVVEGDLPHALAAELLRAPRVAIDTETSGLNWSSDELLLCQVFTEATGTVLVKTTDRRAERLIELLRAPTVLKVFHFAPFDLRFLQRAWGVKTRFVACTKTASKILEPSAPSAEHSLQSLVKRELGIQIEKGPVRVSDWGQARLTPEQIAYASSDVSHLFALLDRLLARLRAVEREELYWEVCGYLPTDAYLRVNGFPSPLEY